MNDVDLEEFEVEMPAGGRIPLHSPEEVEVWNSLKKHYIEDYGLTKGNDLSLVGVMLSQQIEQFRAQQRLNGMRVKFTEEGVPTGEYERVVLTDTEKSDASKAMKTASGEIRAVEAALGIDKKSRDVEGPHELADYIDIAKKAAHEYGVHICDRVKFIEGLAMALKTDIRVLDNGDAEDRGYHNISEKTIVDRLRKGLAEMERRDKEWAKEVGVLFRGKL